MNRKLVPLVVAILAGAVFFGGALAPVDEDASSQVAPAAAALPWEVAVAGDVEEGAARIAALANRVSTDPDDPTLHAQLALAYLQNGRDAADPSKLRLAEQALDRSLELEDQDNLEAFVGMASLANARHDFSQSVKWSRRAIETDRYEAASYGLLGDALFELGRVDAADAAYQQMIDVRPDVASYVRGSYALQYHGRTRAALGVMRLALRAAGPNGETAAWVRHQMGDIYAGLRDFRRSARENRIGIQIAPGYVPPTVGLAEAYISMGRLADALPIMERAARRLPSLEYLITLGDLYAATGRAADAETQYEVVARKLADHRAAGVGVDADFTVFYADHGLRPAAALREARVGYEERPTQKMADALAWMLHSTGRTREAWPYARRALRGPVKDAGIMFHAGVIAEELGNHGLAASLMQDALRSDPTFSTLQVPVARRIARG